MDHVPSVDYVQLTYFCVHLFIKDLVKSPTLFLDSSFLYGILTTKDEVEGCN